MSKHLASAVGAIGPRYDALVVGSGYGGGVAASRLARMGLKVAVLERGREWLPGEFPTSVIAAQRETRFTGAMGRIGASTALFDIRLGDDVHVMQASGLGGTSLINANVCLAPEPKVLEDRVWPARVRVDHWLQVGFRRARDMLAPATLPVSSTPLKLKALDTAAQSVGARAERVPLHIAFEAGVNAAGVTQPACIECGDCLGGCNVGAKTTVHSTYLADAVNHGASLFTHAEVRFIERAGDDGWRVTYHRLDEAARSMPLRRVAARMLVIAAGTLGTNEILLRSRERGLPLSNRLGQRVSTNADAIAFGYNNDQRINAVGTGARRRGRDPAVGPAVAGLVDLRTSRGFAIVEAAIQSAMAPVLPLAMSAGAVLGSDSDRGLRDRLEEFGRTAASLIGGSGKGAVANTQVFLAIGHDSASGRIVLDHDRPRIIWPGAAKEPVYARIEEALKSLVAATGGTYVPNPVSKRLLGGNLFTVHPLGGSTMADSATEGVVDERCRVFDPTSPDGAVHAGLYVMDGSIVPRSLGVHPLLTITALAERAMLLFARDQGLRLGVAPKADAPRRDLVLAAEA